MRVDILVLFLNLVGSFQLSTIGYCVGCGFVVNGLYYVEICSLLYPLWWEFWFFCGVFSPQQTKDPLLNPECENLPFSSFALLPVRFNNPLICMEHWCVCLFLLLCPFCCSDESFIMNGCWILSDAFCASIEMITWFLSFLLLMWCITLIDLCVLNHPCDPRINSTWSCYMILLMHCWIQFANILFFFNISIGV